MASGGGAEQHLPHHLQQHAGSVDVQSVVGVSGMGDSPGEGEGQAGDLVVGGHQPPASEGKGIKKAKREVVGGEEKKKENPTDWSECAVNYLLEVYEEKYVSLSRGNLRSNDWEDVARYVNFKCEGSRSAKTAEQCKWKMENLKRRYKVEKQRQAATGAVSSLWPFFPRMDEMLISSFKFVATSPENGSGDAEDHPANVSVVSFSPQRVNRGAHAINVVSRKFDGIRHRPMPRHPRIRSVGLERRVNHKIYFTTLVCFASQNEISRAHAVARLTFECSIELSASEAFLPEASQVRTFVAVKVEDNESHNEAEVGFKKESDVYGSCAVGSVTIKELQKRMADFARERDWDQFHSPRNLLLALVGEVGELSEIFQWKGEVPRGLPGWNVSEKEHLGEELSDVLLYLVRLADICEVDLGQAALRKIKKNAKKYPVELCKGTARKYTPCENPNGDDVALDKI
ncbi:hypothetical protein AXG93_544s1000 [Marchantia polymorpha subsp. ruderalis]|uniref:Myb/SANT-like DNA-binding domain-containing protein n=1 Tax=Marchantia polymorpha subsp. ruderalis TaxID=1480154 RepID=A0A176VHN9_MARPO|nr:hypothetical protein AXG93_544s1000 [Marchantia polymorpha subsp. ruderalis]